MEFSKVVLNRLYDLKMSKSELAKEMGISNWVLTDRMYGRSLWNEILISKACEVLKIKVEFKEIS